MKHFMFVLLFTYNSLDVQSNDTVWQNAIGWAVLKVHGFGTFSAAMCCTVCASQQFHRIVARCCSRRPWVWLLKIVLFLVSSFTHLLTRHRHNRPHAEIYVCQHLRRCFTRVQNNLGFPMERILLCSVGVGDTHVANNAPLEL